MEGMFRERGNNQIQKPLKGGTPSMDFHTFLPVKH